MGELEVLTSDSLRGWELGKPRPLREPTGGDAWLEDGNWTRERVLQELIVKRLEAVSVLGGYRSKGFGRVRVELVHLRG